MAEIDGTATGSDAAESITYDGVDHELNVNVDSVTPAEIPTENYAYAWTYNGQPISGQNGNSIDVRNAGEYVCTVTATVGATDYEQNVTFTVNKVSLSGKTIVVTPKEGVVFPYNGAAQVLSADQIESVTVNGIDMPVSDCEFSNYANNTAVGQATATVAAKATSVNFEGSASGVNVFEITKADPKSVSLEFGTDNVVAYGAADAGVKYYIGETQVHPNSANVDITYVKSDGTTTTTWSDISTTPGDYKAYATFKATAPYYNQGSTDEYAFTIAAEDISSDITLDPATETFGVTPNDVDVNVNSMDPEDYSVSWSQDDKQITDLDETLTVGTYTVTVTSKDGTKSGSATFTVTAANANTIDVTWNTADETAEYSADGLTKTVGYTGGSFDIEKGDIVLKGVEGYAIPEDNYSISVSPSEVKDVRDYTVTVTIDDPNYTAAAAGNTLTFTVETATNMTANEAFSRGALAEAKDNGNYANDVDQDIAWTYDGEAHYVVPTKVLPYGERDAVDVDDGWFKTTYEKYDETTKAWVSCSNPDVDCVDAGSYRAVVTPVAGSHYAQGGSDSFYAYFDIEAIDIAGAQLFDDSNAVKDMSDATFTWNARAQQFGVVLDGVDITADVTLTLYNEQRSEIGSIVTPGTYYVGIEANDGGNYTGSVKDVRVVVDKLDLANAGLFVNDTDHALARGENADQYLSLSADSPIAVADFGKLLAEIDASLDSTMTELGEYTLTVTPKDEVVDTDGNDREAYVTGSWSSDFNYVETLVPAANFYYGDETLAAFSGEVFNAGNGDVFDPSKVVVYQTGNVKYDADQYQVVVTKDGAVVTDYTQPGDYTVTVSMIPGADYALGGKATAEFSVVSGSLAECDVIVTDAETGKVIPTTVNKTTVYGTPFTYDGEDVANNFGVKVVKDGTELVEGTDYRIVVTEGDSLANDGKVVEGATTVGTYWLNIVGVTYADWTAVQFTVDPVDVKMLKVQQQTFHWKDGGYAQGIPYTGSALTPVIMYTDKATPAPSDWKVLPAELYRLDNFKFQGKDIEASGVVETGSYLVEVLPLATDLAKNYDFTGVVTVLSFDVIDRMYFEDVPAAEWYAAEIYDAFNKGYINGYGGTRLFGPDNAITRGETATIVFNMAGKTNADLDVNPSDVQASVTYFDDVALGEFYTPAVNWCYQSKVVMGYPDGTYAPMQNITREEVAVIFYNYEMAKKGDVSVEDAAATIAEYADGAQVSDWAETAVAWAIEKGIFGQGTDVLRPQDNISRAEVAAMAVRSQA